MTDALTKPAPARAFVEGWKAIAAALGRSQRWCRYAATRDADPLPVFKVGGGVRLNRADLEDWLGRQRDRTLRLPAPAGAVARAASPTEPAIRALWFDAKGCGPDLLAIELHPFAAEFDGRIPASLGIRVRRGGDPIVLLSSTAKMLDGGFQLGREPVEELHRQLGAWLARVAPAPEGAAAHQVRVDPELDAETIRRESNEDTAALLAEELSS